MPEQYSNFQKIRWGALFLIALGIAGLALLQRHDNPGASLPVLGAIPEFSLRAEDGRTVTRRDFVGKIVVTDFIFTHCAGTCPVMTSQMADLQKTFVNEPGMILVSMSVDPERDTPQRLQQYAKNAGAKEGQWIFLTGGKTDVHHLARNGFHLGVAETGGSEAEPIIHSAKFVLLDRQARIRGYYDGTEDESVRKLAGDIRTLLNEKQ